MGKPLIRMFYDLIEDVRLLWPGSHLYAGPVVARIVVSGGQGEGVLRGRKKGTQGEEQQLFRHSSRPIKMIYSRESFLAFQGTNQGNPLSQSLVTRIEPLEPKWLLIFLLPI